MGKGIDRAVPFRSMKDLMKIKKYGYTFIGRYLSRSLWKSLSLKESKLISDAGMYVVSVYQNSNNKPSYFTSARGVQDAQDAIRRAHGVAQPLGSVIYFAVDFDTNHATIDQVQAYFDAVYPIVNNAGYHVGVYGSYFTCSCVRVKLPHIRVWQTVAWSKGNVLKDAHLYQSKIDTPLPEAKELGNVDLLTSNGNAGGWKVGT